MRTGKFTASRISELCSGGQGKTRLNYIFDIAKEMVAGKDDFQTKEMLHGTINQYDAFDLAFKPLYGGAWFDTFVSYNDKLGASPDILGDGFVADIKCPYYIHTFFEQMDKLPKKYGYQVQTQMLTMNVDMGYLCNYLTKPDEYNVQWVEYPFILEQRTHIHEIKKSEEIQDEILKAVEDNFPLIGTAHELMLNAKEIAHDEFFFNQFNGVRYLKLKDTNWINKNDCIRFGNDFFTTKN